MDKAVLGGALSQGPLMTGHPQESKAIQPSSGTFRNVGEGFLQPRVLICF